MHVRATDVGRDPGGGAGGGRGGKVGSGQMREEMCNMARQPLPENLRRGSWVLGIDAIQRQPNCIALIGACLTAWPFVETQMASLLGILLRAHTEGAMAVYLTIRTGRARRDALDAAAEAFLEGPDLSLYRAILNVYSAAESERNALAHGCYGVHDEIPDGVLWIETKHQPRESLAMLTREVRGEAHSGSESNYKLSCQMFVYREHDLEAVRKLIFDTHRILHIFNFEYLRPSGFFPRDAKFKELTEMPLLRDALNSVP